MNFIFVIFTVLLVISLVQCDDNDEIKESTKNKYLGHYFRRKEHITTHVIFYTEPHCPGFAEKFKIANQTFDNCVNKIDDSLTLCAMAERYVLNCSVPLFETLDYCFYEQTKGLPELAFKSLYSVIDHLCHQTGETLLELLNLCLWDDLELKVPNEQMDKCEEKLQSTARKYRQDPPSQSDICSDLTSFRSCIETRVALSCKNTFTRNAFLNLYDAFKAPCNNINKV